MKKRMKYKKYIPFWKYLSFAKNEIFPHKNDFIFPFLGSLKLETRIVLYPNEFYYRKIHDLNRIIKIPVSIKINDSFSELVQTYTNLDYKKNEPIIISLKKILVENNLDLNKDYALNLNLEIKLRPSNINFQMKYQDGTKWGNFIAHWPNFNNNKSNLVMLSPKIKKSDSLKVYNLLMYTSTNKELEQNLKCKYILLNEKGINEINEECNIKKGSFVIIPSPEKIDKLKNGRYFLSATANTAAVSLSISLNEDDKFVDMEHTQPIYKYHSKERKISDIKKYWQNQIENNEY